MLRNRLCLLPQQTDKNGMAEHMNVFSLKNVLITGAIAGTVVLAGCGKEHSNELRKEPQQTEEKAMSERKTIFTMKKILITSAIAGAVVLAGCGIKRYSNKLQKELRARFYEAVARVLCRFFNDSVKPDSPYTEEQLQQMLISGKHGGVIPGLHQVKLRISYVKDGQYEVSLLVYRGTELTTLTFSSVSWSDLPADIQSNTIHAAGDATEYMLLD